MNTPNVCKSAWFLCVVLAGLPAGARGDYVTDSFGGKHCSRAKRQVQTGAHQGKFQFLLNSPALSIRIRRRAAADPADPEHLGLLPPFKRSGLTVQSGTQAQRVDSRCIRLHRGGAVEGTRREGGIDVQSFCPAAGLHP